MGQYRSRIKNRVKNTLYKNTAFSVAAIVVMVVIVLFFGLQLLINITLLLGKIKSTGDIPSNSQTELILPPRLNPMAEATNSAIIEVSGFGTQPGQTIELYLNRDFKTKSIVDNDLQFVISELRLETGENQIGAKARIGDKESAFSEELTVVYETTPPALEVQEPFEGQVIKKTPQARVAGNAEPDATVLINSYLPIVDSSGNFSYLLPLTEGENLIKIVARDKAGNQTTNEIKITFVP